MYISDLSFSLWSDAFALEKRLSLSGSSPSDNLVHSALAFFQKVNHPSHLQTLSQCPFDFLQSLTARTERIEERLRLQKILPSNTPCKLSLLYSQVLGQMRKEIHSHHVLMRSSLPKMPVVSS